MFSSLPKTNNICLSVLTIFHLVAILVAFGWLAGWNLIYKPATDKEIKQFRENPKYKKTWELIHHMLQVSFRNLVFFRFNVLILD